MSAAPETRALPAGRSYPLDYMDRGCLAIMSEPHGCSNAPTWEFRVRGSIDPQHCRTALRDVLSRYPTCRSTVQPLRPGRMGSSRSLAYVVHEEFELDELFHYTDFTGEPRASLETLRQEVRDRFLDPFQRFPLHVTLARVSPEECRLLFQHHHMLADARGFIALLTDFAGFLEHAARGTRPDPKRLEPYGKRSELDALQIGRLRSWLWGIAGFGIWARMMLGSLLRPLKPSFHNLSFDYSGQNGTVYLKLDSEVLEEWRALRKPHGLSLTALLACAFLLANRRWNDELGVESGWTTIALVAETRPRDENFHSFANHLSGLVCGIEMGDPPEPLEMMREVQDQLVRQVQRNENKKRLVFERVLTRALPVDLMRQVVFDSKNVASNLNFSNAIAVDFPKLQGKGWSAEEVFITTPTQPPHGVLLTAVHYNGKLCFNLNHTLSIVTRDQAGRLSEHFEAACRELESALARPA